MPRVWWAMKIKMHKSDDLKQLNWHLNANRERERERDSITYIKFSFRMNFMPTGIGWTWQFYHIHGWWAILTVIYFSINLFFLSHSLFPASVRVFFLFSLGGSHYDIHKNEEELVGNTHSTVISDIICWMLLMLSLYKGEIIAL